MGHRAYVAIGLEDEQRIACCVSGETLAEGEGHSKKEAEQRAAFEVLRSRATPAD